MFRREKFNFPDYYPFGIEIEFSNKSISDIYDIIEEDSNLILVNKSFSEIYELFGEKYADIITFKNKFALKENENRYWLFSIEDTNLEEKCSGSEISSPIIYNRRQDLRGLWDVLEIYSKYGIDVNEYCGIHIHMGTRPFNGSYQKLLNYFLFYLYYEPVLYKLSAMGNFGHVRKGAFTYANPIVFQMTKDIVDERALKRYIKQNSMVDSKTNSLHFFNFQINDYEYGSSFESRIFNCTLNSFVIGNYINTTMSSLHYCVSDRFNQQEMVVKCQEAINTRKNWHIFDSFVDYADQLVEEFADKIFLDNYDKDLFYEQYSGRYLGKSLYK